MGLGTGLPCSPLEPPALIPLWYESHIPCMWVFSSPHPSIPLTPEMRAADTQKERTGVAVREVGEGST